MPPKTIQTPEEREAWLRQYPVFAICEPRSHHVDVFGRCPCGRFREEDKK